jgi:signal transduction histidine kinase
LKSKIGFASGVFLFCCAYWMLDSAWSFLSFEKNLSALVFQEPMSYIDTVLLEVSPYQIVSRIMVTAIFIGTGTIIALFFLKQKRVEKEKIRLERQLQQAHKMESIGTLAGGISHDFNNILYGAIGYTDLCLDDAAPGTLLHSNLEEIKSGLLRAKSLTKQILAFSRQNDSEIEPTMVAPVVKEIVQFLRATIPSTIKIKMDTNVTESTIMGNPTKIHQIVMNLCTNAVHAMEEDGGILEITIDQMDTGYDPNSRADDDLRPGAYIRLRVTDTGIGIAPDDLNRVFDPYFTSKEQGKGTGMGLAVVHGIVQSYHGHISVESREGVGSRFDIYFPILKENGTRSEKGENLNLPQGNEHIQLNE